MTEISSIKKVTELSEKHYLFDNEHNPRLLADYWHQQTPEGNTLFLVFYSMACRYSQCLGCNLPSRMSEHHVSFKDIMLQVDYVFNNILSDTDKQSLNKIIISNNGSILDEDTFSTTALMYLFARINMECDKVSTLTIETRPEYVELEELELLSRLLGEGATPTALEIAIGFEAFDDKIRNEYFHKGLDLDKVEGLVSKMAMINARAKLKSGYKYGSDLQLKTYFMLKPVPQITEEQAVKDIQGGIDYLHGLSQKYGIKINMHLNPTYVAKGTALQDAFESGEYTPPHLASVVEAVRYGKGKELSIYVGLNDEGLAVEHGSFCDLTNPEDVQLIALLEAFNKSQDYELLYNFK